MCPDEICTSPLQVKLQLGGRTVRNECSWMSFAQRKKAWVLQSFCTQVDISDIVVEVFHVKSQCLRLFLESISSRRDRTWTAVPDCACHVGCMVGGCMKMPSLTSGWCNATCSSGWKLLAACCPSLRWDVALLGAVHSVRAARPGCSSLLPEPCPWAACGEEGSRRGWECKRQAVAHHILSEVFKE